ncbi:MAG: TIGR01906 family membrane protein [Floccifex sp.]
MKSFLSYIFGWCLIIICVVFGIQSIALDASFYTKRYETYCFDEVLHVSQENLEESITVLLDYIKDDRDDMVVIQNGKEVFNERETLHMKDVKQLYQNAHTVMKISIVLAIGILFYFLLKEKRWLSFLTMGFLRVCATLFVILVFFGIWVATDFTSFWNWLHTILFNNQLWLLDPNTSFMINMLPEIIFNELVLSIVLYLCICVIPLLLFSLYYQFKKAPIGFEKKQ